MEELKQEIFVPLNISTRKGRRVCVAKPEDNYTITPLSKLLTKAYIVQKMLLEKDPKISQREFCETNKISPRYLRGILQFNHFSPKIKKMIMAGWMSKNFSTQQILTGKIPLLWVEQEKLFF